MPTEIRETPIIVITYHDAFLWSKKHNKTDYENGAAVILLSEKDLKALGVSSGQAITLRNKLGKIQVHVRVDKSCPKGFGFVPKSPVINQIIGWEEKLPNFKWVETIARA